MSQSTPYQVPNRYVEAFQIAVGGVAVAGSAVGFLLKQAVKSAFLVPAKPTDKKLSEVVMGPYL